MLTMTVTLDLTILYFVAANFIAILVYVLIIKHRARREKRNTTAITTAISEYFSKNGMAVSVRSISLQGNKRYTAFVQCEPMKRLRLSHMIESTLCDHVQQACGLELEKVYWRFPINPDKQATESGDEYFNEGLANLLDPSNYEIEESSLEIFKEATHDPAPAHKPSQR
jgi:hypothetical protein